MAKTLYAVTYLSELVGLFESFNPKLDFKSAKNFKSFDIFPIHSFHICLDMLDIKAIKIRTSIKRGFIETAKYKITKYDNDKLYITLYKKLRN